MSHVAQVWSYDQAIKAGPKSVLNALAWRADRTTWRACPGVSQLADDTGLDERSVRRNLDWLEEHGLIARRRRHAGGGRRKGERLVDEFELNPSRAHADNLPVTSPDNLPATESETTGHFDGDYRTNLQRQPDNLSPPYKEEPSIEPSTGTKIVNDHDLLGDVLPEKTQRKRTEPNRRTAMPSQWPDDALKTEAANYWLAKGRADLIEDIDDEAESARQHHLKNGNQFVDWAAAWRTWFRRTPNMRRAPHGTKSKSMMEAARRYAQRHGMEIDDHG